MPMICLFLNSIAAVFCFSAQLNFTCPASLIIQITIQFHPRRLGLIFRKFIITFLCIKYLENINVNGYNARHICVFTGGQFFRLHYKLRNLSNSLINEYVYFFPYYISYTQPISTIMEKLIAVFVASLPYFGAILDNGQGESDTNDLKLVGIIS